ncbi:type VI secretion system baseplate subunit TssE [Methylomonas sp. MK1]|jgi:type VI secretion system protein ImpF|uniref:type VI secretion system baseplate subunit TssE n=1 Tax=Methylomonas sp. MK1 TaxID=1131552 RepID=UPI00037B0D62|nr:type VI secretion system baseplate subunit TssE [Methylomonas sp. MK1]
MADLLHAERLQPSLLDRLTDEAPEKRAETREQRVMSLRQLRQSVLRDLSWLLNTAAFESMVNLADYPFVARSVLNYGTPVLSGVSLTGIDVKKIERKVRQAINDFEPRILADSLSVELAKADDQMNHKALSFRIEGDLWAQPLPVHLYIRSDLDLETGEISVKELDG